jgi:TRAP-type C4-dicarboxylate transport system permease small subunit
MIAHLRTWADRLIGLSATIGAVGLLVEVAVILTDVIGRAFGYPLYGSQDMITMTMVILVFGGMAMAATSLSIFSSPVILHGSIVSSIFSRQRLAL